MTTRPWSDDEALLRKLAADGLDSYQLAARLGRTRSSVMGHCHRLGIRLNTRTGKQRTATAKKGMAKRVAANGGADPFSGTKPKRSTAKPRTSGRRPMQFGKGVGRPASEPQTVPTLTAASPEAIAAAVSIAAAGYRHCRWPVAEPDPITAEAPIFCGRRTREPGMSWCAEHAVVVFNPAAQPRYIREAMARAAK